MASLGLWLDDPIKRILSRSYFAELAAMRIHTLALMVDTSRKGWDPKWRQSTLRELNDLVTENGMELILTVWPDPVSDYLKAMEEGIDELLEAVPATGVEYDTEFNWTKRRVKGFKPQRRHGRRQSALDVAGDELVALTARLKAKHPQIRSELTTFTSHTENGRAADVAPHMDRLMPQAYSVRERTRKGKDWNVPWTHTYGPGRMQRFTLDRTLLADGDQAEMGCGLAAYDQKWPGRDAADAMGAAYEAAMAYDVVEIRYWSSKWILGVRDNKYAAEFLKDLAQRC